MILINNMYSNQIIQSIELHRDGLRSPWGFRLKGGIDVDGGIPLEIIKVRQVYEVKPRFWNTGLSAANGIPESR